VRVRRPLAKKSTANQRKEHNVEKYFQWIYTTLSLTVRDSLHSFSCCWLPNLRNKILRKFELTAIQGHL